MRSHVSAMEMSVYNLCSFEGYFDEYWIWRSRLLKRRCGELNNDCFSQIYSLDWYHRPYKTQLHPFFRRTVAQFLRVTTGSEPRLFRRMTDCLILHHKLRDENGLWRVVDTFT